VDRFKRLALGGAIASLAVVALGAPASASDTQGTLAIVNGIPGKRVDVCVNGKEIKSGLRYGKVVLRDVIPIGTKHLKFYERDPRACRGDLVGRETFTLDSGDDFTIVVTRKAPRVVPFDNASLGEIPPLGVPFGVGAWAMRHASELSANFRFRNWTPDPEDPITPAADPVWTKGDHLQSGWSEGRIVQLRVTRAGEPDTLAVKKATLVASHRYEWIFVGTNPGNARIVFIDRVMSQPS